MKTLLQSLIVWLMLVAIPFQGLATASVLARAPAPVVAAMAPGHCAGMAAATPYDGGARHHHTGGKCNTCASCCCGAVMAPPALTVHMPGPASSAAAFHCTDDPVARVDLALPERPPKTALT